MRPKCDRCGGVAGTLVTSVDQNGWTRLTKTCESSACLLSASGALSRPARPRLLSQARVDMLGVLRQLAPATAQELAPLLGVHDQSARGVLLRLLTAGLVGRDYTRRPTGVHSGNGAYRWWLTAAGTAALEQQEREGRCVLLGVGSVRR